MFSVSKYVRILAILTFALAATSVVARPKKFARWKKVDKLSSEFEGKDKWKYRTYNDKWAGRRPGLYKSSNVRYEGYKWNKHIVLDNTVAPGKWKVLKYKHDNLIRKKKKGQTITDADIGKGNYHWINNAVVIFNEPAKPGWYYECRMRASDTSLSSSFWFRLGQYSEIDVIEHIGRPSVGTWTFKENKARSFESNSWIYQRGNPNFKPRAKGKISYRMPKRGRDGFAIYGLHWHADGKTLDMYYNNKYVHTVKPEVSACVTDLTIANILLFLQSLMQQVSP